MLDRPRPYRNYSFVGSVDPSSFRLKMSVNRHSKKGKGQSLILYYLPGMFPEYDRLANTVFVMDDGRLAIFISSCEPPYMDLEDHKITYAGDKLRLAVSVKHYRFDSVIPIVDHVRDTSGKLGWVVYPVVKPEPRGEEESASSRTHGPGKDLSFAEIDEQQEERDKDQRANAMFHSFFSTLEAGDYELVLDPTSKLKGNFVRPDQVIGLVKNRKERI